MRKKADRMSEAGADAQVEISQEETAEGGSAADVETQNYVKVTLMLRYFSCS